MFVCICVWYLKLIREHTIWNLDKKCYQMKLVGLDGLLSCIYFPWLSLPLSDTPKLPASPRIGDCSPDSEKWQKKFSQVRKRKKKLNSKGNDKSWKEHCGFFPSVPPFFSFLSPKTDHNKQCVTTADQNEGCLFLWPGNHTQLSVSTTI